MGRREAFLIGLVAGALAVFGWHTATVEDLERRAFALRQSEVVIVRDTIRTACCDELLEHFARAHGAGAR